MFFVLGLDEDFKYNANYIRIISSTEGSIKFIKGKIAEEIRHENYKDGYILLKGLSHIEKNQDVFEKLILVLETLREEDSIFKEEELNILEKAKNVSGYFKPYYCEAIIKKEDKDYEAALNSINKYLELTGEDSEDIIALRNSILKSLNYEAGKALIYEDPKTAIKLLLPILEDNPEDASLYYYIGVSYRVLENFQKSIYYLTEALNIDNNLVQVVNELGINYASLGNYDTGISYLRKAFEATKSIEICTNLVMCYLNSGKYEEAKDHLAIAKKLNPKDEIVLELEKVISEL